ncbi:thermonuclease family protein [Zwartia vadi]|uniref:thermonuclease family protein n=1 Tax=Zwartia vadi TaxID=3058168 RepID=UPI0025B2C3A3|nr:thermonuclease family protein [Zwartia vadi]MDN3986714.1 thermonuclease family protein [Zwartia vadi]
MKNNRWISLFKKFNRYGVLFACMAVALFWAVDKIPASPVSVAQASGSQYKLTGKVVRVSDGDTINLLVDNKQERIRLASIDAPETSHGSDQPGQPFGEASRKNLANYVAGKTVTVVCFEKDRYERHICDVPVDGTTANRLQVEQGMAWANQQAKGKYLRDRSLPELEKNARQKKIGLWSEPDAVAPWEWRVVCWKNKKCS